MECSPEHEGALVQDIGSLRQQLSAVATDGTVKYGAAFMTVRTNTDDFKVGLVDSLRELFNCVVSGYKPGNGCYAYGDFTGSPFEHSGFESVRHVADFDGQQYNGGQGSIDFTVPPTITSVSQQGFYTEIKAAMQNLGISI